MHIFVISSAIWRPGGGSFNRILQHLQQPQFIAADLVLLAAVMFHAFNGFRILLLDAGIGVRRHKPVFWALMVVTAALPDGPKFSYKEVSITRWQLQARAY